MYPGCSLLIMPSKSKAQFRMMAAACRGGTRADVSRSVACEFHQEDRSTKQYKKLPEKKKQAEVTPEYLEMLAELWDMYGRGL